MPVCPTQTFANVTPEQFAVIQKKAQASGIPLSGNSGAASKFGGKFEWNYDAATLTLNITVTAPPLMMNCETVNSKIGAMIQEVQA